MKPAAWFGLTIILASIAFGASAFVRNLTPYVTFPEARQSKASVQVMGKLDKDSVVAANGKLNFVIVQADGDRMPVTFVSAPPPNFARALEVTVRGSFDGQQMQADNLLVKCPSKYQGTETQEYKSGQS